MPRIASLQCNFRNPTNTSNPAYLQANLLLVGIWRVKPPDNNLYVNIHCYLLLTLASFYYTIDFHLTQFRNVHSLLLLRFFPSVSLRQVHSAQDTAHTHLISSPHLRLLIRQVLQVLQVRRQSCLSS